MKQSPNTIKFKRVGGPGECSLDGVMKCTQDQMNAVMDVLLNISPGIAAEPIRQWRTTRPSGSPWYDMDENDPFERQDEHYEQRTVYATAAQASPAKPDLAGLTDDARMSIERAAGYLEHYAAYLREVKPDDIERHPYIPSVEESASELRTLLAAITKEPPK